MKKINRPDHFVRGPFLFLVLLLSVLTGITLTAYAASTGALDNWKISSGPVKVISDQSSSSGKRVKGTFKLESKLQAPGTRRAGSCLLADLTAQGVGLESCQTHQQCNDAYQAAPHPVLGSGPTGPYLYCLGERSKRGSKQCWIRPGTSETHCRKETFSPGEYELPKMDNTVQNSDSVDANPLDGDDAVHWLVYGCLNPENGNPPPCANPASTAKVNSIGPLKKVRP